MRFKLPTTMPVYDGDSPFFTVKLKNGFEPSVGHTKEKEALAEAERLLRIYTKSRQATIRKYDGTENSGQEYALLYWDEYGQIQTRFTNGESVPMTGFNIEQSQHDQVPEEFYMMVTPGKKVIPVGYDYEEVMKVAALEFALHQGQKKVFVLKVVQVAEPTIPKVDFREPKKPSQIEAPKEKSET